MFQRLPKTKEEWIRRLREEGAKLDIYGDRVPVKFNKLIERWQKKHPGETLDLSGGNFSGLELSYLNLSGVDLTGANFWGAKLDEADFSGATLVNAQFNRAELRHLQIEDIDLTKAEFIDAKMMNTRFRNVTLQNADFTDATIDAATFIDSDLSNSVFAGTKIGLTSFDKSNLAWADFSDAEVEMPCFLGAEGLKMIIVDGNTVLPDDELLELSHFPETAKKEHKELRQTIHKLKAEADSKASPSDIENCSHSKDHSPGTTVKESSREKNKECPAATQPKQPESSGRAA